MMQHEQHHPDMFTQHSVGTAAPHLNCACTSSGASMRGTCQKDAPDALNLYP